METRRRFLRATAGIGFVSIFSGIGTEGVKATTGTSQDEETVFFKSPKPNGPISYEVGDTVTIELGFNNTNVGTLTFGAVNQDFELNVTVTDVDENGTGTVFFDTSDIQSENRGVFTLSGTAVTVSEGRTMLNDSEQLSAKVYDIVTNTGEQPYYDEDESVDDRSIIKLNDEDSDTEPEVGNLKQDVRFLENSRASINTVVEDAPQNNPVELPVAKPLRAAESTLADAPSVIAEISITPRIDTDFELDIVTGSEKLETTPDTEYDTNGISTLGYLHVDTDLKPILIQEVIVEFQIKQGVLSELGTAPEAVALYRFDENTETWKSESTEMVQDEDEFTKFRTTTDGFSEWTVAAKTPDISIVETNLSATQDIDIEATLTNDGSVEGNYTLPITVDGTEISSQELSIPPGETTSITVTVTHTVDEPGTYTVKLGDTVIGDVTVGNEPTATPSDAGTPTPEAETATSDTETPTPETETADGNGPGFGVGGALVSLGGLSYLLKQRLLKDTRPQTASEVDDC